MSEEQLSGWEASIPTLPDARKARYVQDFGLSAYDAEKLTASPEIADYFEAACALTAYPRQAANLILTEVFRLMASGGDDLREIPVSPATWPGW